MDRYHETIGNSNTSSATVTVRATMPKISAQRYVVRRAHRRLRLAPRPVLQRFQPACLQGLTPPVGLLHSGLSEKQRLRYEFCGKQLKFDENARRVRGRRHPNGWACTKNFDRGRNTPTTCNTPMASKVKPRPPPAASACCCCILAQQPARLCGSTPFCCPTCPPLQTLYQRYQFNASANP